MKIEILDLFFSRSIYPTNQDFIQAAKPAKKGQFSYVKRKTSIRGIKYD